MNGRADRTLAQSRLNEFLRAIKDARLDALDALRDDEYRVFISIGCDIFGMEAARISLAEWLASIADADQDQAA